MENPQVCVSDDDEPFVSGTSTVEYFDNMDGVRRASHFIEDAMFGIRRVHPKNSSKAQWAYRLHLHGYYILSIITWAYVLLTFFEFPLWCIRRNGKVTPTSPIQDYCDSPLYPVFGVPSIPRWGDCVIEILLLLILMADAYLLYLAKGSEYILKSKLNVAFVALLGIAAADIVWAYTTPWSWFRLAPYVRVAILTIRRVTLHKQIEVIYRIIPEFASMAFLMSCFVLIYAWFGVLIFDDQETKLYFPNLLEAMWQLLVLLTTANYPDVMMPIYTNYRVSVLFFVSFLMLGLFFGLNMVTAIIYTRYKEVTSAQRETHNTLRRENLETAFRLLDRDKDGFVGMKTIFEVFWQLNHNDEIAYVDENRSRLLYAALDRNGDGGVTINEFGMFCDILQVQFERIWEEKPIEVQFPVLSQYTVFRGFYSAVNHIAFEWVIDCLLLLNGILFALESYGELTGKDAGGSTDLPKTTYGTVLNVLEGVFTGIFTLEMLSKMWIFGLRGYWSTWKNRFDGIVTIVTLIVTAIVYYPNNFNNTKFIRFVMMLRLLRLIRLLTHFKHFQLICYTFIQMLPSASKLLQVLFILMYTYSSLGIQLFGGLINMDPNEAQWQRLQGSGFVASVTTPYLPNNFNDMFSGMITLFELLVVNNWFVIVSGYTAVTSDWAKLFFVAFYISGVIVCLNILVAFILDIATEVYDNHPATVEILAGAQAVGGSGNSEPKPGMASPVSPTQQFNSGQEGVLENSRTSTIDPLDGSKSSLLSAQNVVVFDAHQITGTKTGLKGRYKAVLPRHAQASGAASDVIKDIFAMSDPPQRAGSPNTWAGTDPLDDSRASWESATTPKTAPTSTAPASSSSAISESTPLLPKD